MGGFSMALAGGLAGLGKGIVSEAKAKREEAMKMLEMALDDRRLQEDRAFRAGENEKTRAHDSKENALTRSIQDTSEITDAEGNVLLRRGSDVTPLKMKNTPPVDDRVYKEGEVAKVGSLTPKETPVKIADKDAGVNARARDTLIQDEVKSLRESNAFREEPLTDEQINEMAVRNVDARRSGTTTAKTKSSNTENTTVDKNAVIAQAKEAIKGGADPETVKQRMIKLGVDPKAAGL